MISREEQLMVGENMISYGGSFVRCLGSCVMSADPFNLVKIKETWPEYWEQYLNWNKSKSDGK